MKGPRPPTDAWKELPVEWAVVPHGHSASEGTPELPIILSSLWPHLLRTTLPTGSRKDSVSSPILGGEVGRGHLDVRKGKLSGNYAGEQNINQSVVWEHKSQFNHKGNFISKLWRTPWR
jgi:hypothetical protein